MQLSRIELFGPREYSNTLPVATEMPSLFIRESIGDSRKCRWPRGLFMDDVFHDPMVWEGGSKSTNGVTRLECLPSTDVVVPLTSLTPISALLARVSMLMEFPDMVRMVLDGFGRRLKVGHSWLDVRDLETCALPCRM